MDTEQDAELERINALIDRLDSVLDGQSTLDCVQALTALLARVGASGETLTDCFVLNCMAHRLLALYFETEMDDRDAEAAPLAPLPEEAPS